MVGSVLVRSLTLVLSSSTKFATLPKMGIFQNMFYCVILFVFAYRTNMPDRQLLRYLLKIIPLEILSDFTLPTQSKNCDVIAIFPIYGQFGAIWKPDSGRKVCKTYIFIKSNLLSYKN